MCKLLEHEKSRLHGSFSWEDVGQWEGMKGRRLGATACSPVTPSPLCALPEPPFYICETVIFGSIVG